MPSRARSYRHWEGIFGSKQHHFATLLNTGHHRHHGKYLILTTVVTYQSSIHTKRQSSGPISIQKNRINRRTYQKKRYGNWRNLSTDYQIQRTIGKNHSKIISWKMLVYILSQWTCYYVRDTAKNESVFLDSKSMTSYRVEMKDFITHQENNIWKSLDYSTQACQVINHLSKNLRFRQALLTGHESHILCQAHVLESTNSSKVFLRIWYQGLRFHNLSSHYWNQLLLATLFSERTIVFSSQLGYII